MVTFSEEILYDKLHFLCSEMRQKSSAPLIVLKNVQKEQKIKVERVNVNIHKKLRFLFLTFSGLEVNLPRLLWDRANFFGGNFFLISRVITMKI